MDRRPIISVGILLLLLALATAARAGGPFRVDEVNHTGVAMRWQDDTLKWCPDTGKLSSKVNNATGLQWIEEALVKWTGTKLKDETGTAVATTMIKAAKDTGCESVDITGVGNPPMYLKYVDPGYAKTVIIFDDTGDIIEDLMPGNREGVVGLSEPQVWDSSGLHLTKGYAIFNGYLQASGILASTQDVSDKLFQATIVHELGHLLNLDHTQVNLSIARDCVRDGACENSQGVPTMYPELKTTAQSLLKRDDQVTVSWIYPTEDLKSKFCVITGEIFDGKGDPLKGVNVIAANVANPITDSRSFVSGVLQTGSPSSTVEGCYGDSRYFLYGIIPGQNYKVTYEPIDPDFTGASSLEPLDPPLGGFSSGTIESQSGDTVVSCGGGGETIEMASLTIDIPNPCTGSTSGGGSGTPTGTTSSKSCGLLPSVAAGLGTAVDGLLVAASLAFLLRLRLRLRRRPL
jgi:hypothetical protein